MVSTGASHDYEEGESPLRYASAYHAPVLWKTVRDELITDPSGCYVDATLGGGGHAAALLDALAADGRVVGIDRDPEAIATAEERLRDAQSEGRFETLRGNFGDLTTLLRNHGYETVDGVLLDLGVSSQQIDDSQRGFSFMEEGPLDMRMDPRGARTADQVVNVWSEAELRRALYEFGEERRSRRIARAIVEARPLETTAELADAVRAVIPEHKSVKTLARVFQGIRIAVNEELSMLERALEQATTVVRLGGRLAVISYHSLEDRRAKRYLRYGNFEGEPVRDLYGNLVAPWEELHRKPIRASEAEIEANPRARSAKLRLAERRPESPDP